MIALMLMAMAQTMSTTVTDTPATAITKLSPAAGVYMAVTDHLVSFFRGEQDRMLNNFSNSVELSWVDATGVRPSRGKASIWSTYSSLFPLNGGSENHTFSCDARVEGNICRISIGLGRDQRIFVAAYTVSGGLIRRVGLREETKGSKLLSSLVTAFSHD